MCLRHICFEVKPVARSGKGGVQKKRKKCGPKGGVGHQKGPGCVREGGVPPPALRAKAFENIDLATQKN